MKQMEFYAKHQNKRPHDFKKHETFYLYIGHYLYYTNNVILLYLIM